MSRRLASTQEVRPFRFEFNGHLVEAVPGDTVASALIASGHDTFSRSIKYHRPRGAYCLSGRCSNCLVRIDGLPNQFACTTPARPDMHVSVQNTLIPSAKVDVLESIDWLFPRGLDHHEMFAGVPVVEDVMAKVARKLAGLGKLPESIAPVDPPVEIRKVEVLIVGGGSSGLACAQALAAHGAAVELIEEQPQFGGRAALALERDDDPSWIEETVASLRQSGVRLTSSAFALGVFRDEGVPVVPVELREEKRLLKFVAQRVVLCNGSSEAMIPFTGNDLPGVYAGRGLARMLLHQQVAPGDRAVVVGGTAESLGLARLLKRSGVAVEAIVDPDGALADGDFRILSGFRPLRAKGLTSVRGLVVEDGNGRRERLKCDHIVLCHRPAPAFELARQAGAEIAFDDALGGFRVLTEDGRTATERIYAAGDVTGVRSTAESRKDGEAVGRRIAEALGDGA